jgi:anion-transporting  ArsA/GET3 family ATPase
MAAELFGSALLAKVVTGNFAMKSLLRAAPALRELGQLEAVRRISVERPRARIVVDMPATGHGIAWLRLPAQMRDLLGGGPLQELSARLARDLVAKDKSSVVIVTLPERLVLEETLELAEAMQHEVGLSPSRIVVNRVPEAIPAHALKEASRLARSEAGGARAAATLVEVLAARDQARSEALSALAEATQGLALAPVLVRDAPTDPSAATVADWLAAEAAA